MHVKYCIFVIIFIAKFCFSRDDNRQVHSDVESTVSSIVCFCCCPPFKWQFLVIVKCECVELSVI